MPKLQAVSECLKERGGSAGADAGHGESLEMRQHSDTAKLKHVPLPPLLLKSGPPDNCSFCGSHSVV